MKTTSFNFSICQIRSRTIAWVLLITLLLPPITATAQQPTGNITDIQSLLTDLGYAPGPIDGVLGQKTIGAIKTFQEEVNVPVDGEPSIELLTLLRRELARRSGPTATITSLTGLVLVNGQETREGVILLPGDVVETMAGAAVELELSEGSSLELGEATKLDVAALAETDTGARTSRVKILWGKLRALLSPGHQKAGSTFDVETPNALIGVKFSHPDIEVSYDEETEETRAFSDTVTLFAKNLITGEEVLIPAGTLAVITAVGIELLPGAAGAASMVPEAAEPGVEAGMPEAAEPMESAAPEAEMGEAGAKTAGKTIGGLSTKTVAIGAGALLAAGGVIAIAGGGGGDGDSDNGSGEGVDPGGIGNIAFTLTWSFSQSGSEGPDIDLWVIDPLGQKLSSSQDGYGLGPTPQGGRIDVDDQGDTGSGDGGGPERAYWPEAQAPEGTYTFGIRYYDGVGIANYTVRVYKNTRLVDTKTGTISSQGWDLSLGTVHLP